MSQQLQVSKGDLLMSIDRSATTEVDMDEETEESGKDSGYPHNNSTLIPQ